MDKLLNEIRDIQKKLDVLRKHSLKETPTRTIVVDPLLEALGWNIRDPYEVQLEYPTVDNKSVDYALLLNRKPVLLVEAKALDDPLSDVKGITQVVGYAANAGIVWCILTNGVVWKVYRSVEQCLAPDKLMYEVSLDPDASGSSTVEQVAAMMWRFSRDQMAKGTLDAIGEQTFTDGKVRKALERIMRDPPRPIVNAVRAAPDCADLSPQQIKHSLERIWSVANLGAVALTPSAPVAIRGDVRPVGDTARVREPKPPAAESKQYTEAQHIDGKPREVIELYRAVDRFCLSLRPEGIERKYTAMTINWWCGKSIFCSMSLLQGGMRVWLKLRLGHLDNVPSFARDVTNVGHHGSGDLELAVTRIEQLDDVMALVRKSFDGQQAA